MSLNNDNYHILFLEIKEQYLTDALAIATGKDKEYIVGFFGNLAIEIINSRTKEQNHKTVEELRKLFADKVIPEINDLDEDE